MSIQSMAIVLLVAMLAGCSSQDDGVADGRDTGADDPILEAAGPEAQADDADERASDTEGDAAFIYQDDLGTLWDGHLTGVVAAETSPISGAAGVMLDSHRHHLADGDCRR